MLLEWSVLKWKEKVALKNRKSAGADRSRVCVVGVGLYENPLFVDKLSYPIMNTVHGHNCFLNNYSAKDLTVNTLLYPVKPSKIMDWERRPPVYYPNWWGTMPMVMFTFLEHYDLTGKKIIPFCTNEGSGIGGSERDLKKICKGADVKSGLSIHGAEAAQSRSQVEAWVRKMM